MRKSQLAINSVSTSGTLEERLAAYSKAGFTNVEFVLGQIKEFISKGATLADFRQLLDGYGLRCIGGFESGISGFGTGEQRAKNGAQIEENCRLLAELGGTILVVGTDGPPSPEASADPLGDLAAACAAVGDRIKDTGVTMCIEFNWSPLVKSLRSAVEVAERSGAANVGVLFDPAHYHCTPSKFEQIHAGSVPFIRHVHVDDMRDKPGELSNCNSDRVAPRFQNRKFPISHFIRSPRDRLRTGF